MKRKTSLHYQLLVLLLLIIGSGTLWETGLTAGAAEGGEPEENRTVGLYRHLAPATVFLSSHYALGHPLADPETTAVGTGFIVDEAGTVLTNAHVVDGAGTITATLYDGQQVRAELVGLDSFTDIAVLRLSAVDRQLPVLKLGDSDQLQIGQKVLVVGSPFGLGFTLSTGIISGLRALPIEVGLKDPLIQTTAPINPGNSGGPLVNSKGRVVGITSAALMGAQNIGFAIPINTAKAVLAELKEKGRVVRPWLGMAGKFLTEDITMLFALPLPLMGGLLVEHVEKGSPAAEAGLQAGTLSVVIAGRPWVLGGDIIVALQGQSVRSPQDFSRVVKDVRVGQTVEIEYLRDGERQRTSAIVRERPSEPLKAAPPPGERPSNHGPRELLGMGQTSSLMLF